MSLCQTLCRRAGCCRRSGSGCICNFVGKQEENKSGIVCQKLSVVSVRNQCLNYLKREGYKQNYIDAYLAKNADQSDYDEFYLLTELQKLLDEALAKLPETYRLIFEMSRLENNSNTEIAEKLNIPLRTVERYKAKAIEILKKDLKDYLPLLLYFHLLS